MSTAAPVRPAAALVESLDAQAKARGAAPVGALPAARSERWKYTSLRALAARRFEAPADAAPAVDLARIAHIPAPRLVIANGRFVPEASDLAGLPEGARLRPLSAPEKSSMSASHAADSDSSDAAFRRWNAALASDGLVLEVDAHVAVDPPVHLVVLGIEDGADRALHLRHRLTLGDGASLSVVEHQLAQGEHRHLVNSVFEVRLGRGATLTQARLQNESSGASLLLHTQAMLGDGACYRRLDLELGAALSRHELDVVLAGEGAVLEANGVLLADGRRHLDTRLGIEHRARDTRCELTWRGLGAQRGRAVFHGGILIAEGADGSDAALSNKNLLLDDGAEIDTQPVLVIHADDIKAAHGATVGRLDAQSLFYLRARGLPLATATAMLTAAFLREPVGVLADEALEAPLLAALEARLAASAAGSPA